MSGNDCIGFFAAPIPENLSFNGRKLDFSEAYFRYAAARAAFEPVADRTKRSIESTFDDRIGYLDNFVKDGQAYILEVLSPLLEFAVNQLAANGCYSLSKDDFFSKYVAENMDDILTVYTQMKQAYEEIQERQRQKNEERVRERKQAVANGEDELGAMLWNGMKRVVDGGKNIAQAVAVYTDEMQRKVKNELFLLCDMMVDYFAEALFDNEHIDLRDPIPAESYKRASVIFDNLENGNVPDVKVDDAAFEVLSLCPYQPVFLEWLLDRYGDENGELQKIADAFCCSLDDTKAECLDQVWSDLNLETEENALTAREKLELAEKHLNYRSDDYHEQIEKALADFDRKARTTDGIEYKTREDAAKARKLMEAYEKIDRSSLESCSRGRDEFIALEKELGLNVEKYEKKLDAEVDDLDLKARTVDGVEYKTLEEAAKARKLMEAYAKIDTTSPRECKKGLDEFLALENELDFHLPKYEKELERHFADLDLKGRTVDGVEYKTLEEAEEAQQQYAALMNIIKENGVESAEHTQNIIDNIDANSYTIPRAAKCRETLQHHLEMLKYIPSNNPYKYLMSTPAKVIIIIALLVIGAEMNGNELLYMLDIAFVIYICINSKRKIMSKMQQAIQAGKYKKAALFYEIAKPSVEEYLNIKLNKNK